MNVETATWLVRVLYAYVGVGALLLPWWHWRGLGRLDTAARRGAWGFRVLISPGLVALWPWMLARAWRGTGQTPEENNAHRKRAGKAGV